MRFNSSYYEGFTPTDIRILPLNNKKKGEFEGRNIFDIQQNYLLKELKQKDGVFLYRKKGLVAQPGTLALFQCEGNIIGMGVIEDISKYNQVVDSKYWGEIKFIPESLVIFYPVDSKELNTIWPNIKLSQVKHKLNAVKFNVFYSHLINRHLFF